MASQVAHRPAIFARLMSSDSESGLGARSQSIPVEGLRWTLSTKSDQRSIGPPQATTAHKAALGPEYWNMRAIAAQARSPASPAIPTPVLTAEAGLVSRRSSGAIFTSAFMALAFRRNS